MVTMIDVILVVIFALLASLVSGAKEERHIYGGCVVVFAPLLYTLMGLSIIAMMMGFIFGFLIVSIFKT